MQVFQGCIILIEECFINDSEIVPYDNGKRDLYKNK